ncbi:EboA domain-containing protein [Marinilongibacter aquaticus]|uniref:EboA domain-containing protein n=1 Tax=Marinilongibacter aquaticus TaxID=2975157 RepID=UPI0021BD490E|nr:EboA domain-containing protein [Marinilongibacter aquaticus]UBM58499.1 EboA domain-containing protein [Marinilongibacter aquaticus]
MKESDKQAQALKLDLVEFCATRGDAGKWLNEKLNQVFDERTFFLAFGMAPKKFDRESVVWSEALKTRLREVNPDFEKVVWTLDELARLAMLLHLPANGNVATIEKLVGSADRRELVLVYKSMPFLLNAEAFKWLYADGIRTNMVDVFDSIVLHNSFASEYLDEAAWNQMVLKAIFMERPIFKIYKLDARKNDSLALILHDFVKERWAAGRLVSPELWRMIDGFASGEMLESARKETESGTDVAKIAAAKVLLGAGMGESFSKALAQTAEKTSWDSIGEQVLALQEA